MLKNTTNAIISKMAIPGRTSTPIMPDATVTHRCRVTFSRKISAERSKPKIGRVKCNATASDRGRDVIAKNHVETPVKVQSPRNMYSPPSLFARNVCVTSRDVFKTVGNVIRSPTTLRRKTCSNGIVSERKRTQ